MKKLISTLLLTSAIASTPALAWHTLNPTALIVATLGDPHPLCIGEVILTDNGPTGTGPENLKLRYTKPISVCTGSTVNFGPIPETGDCNRRLWVLILDPLRGDTRWVESPTIYNACTEVGFEVGGWGSQLPTIPFWFTYH